MTLILNPSDIIIGERQRIDLGDLSDLDSMSDPEVGQILPIIIDQNRLLIDGRRRLAKAVELNWTQVRVEVQEPGSEISKQKKELFADIGRKDRTWQEKVIAVAKVHRLIAAQKADEGVRWTTRAMAVFTGLSQSGISNMLRVASQIQRMPEVAAACSSFDEALQRLVIEPSEALAVEELNRRAAEATKAKGFDSKIIKTEGDEGEFLDGSPDEDTLPETIEPATIYLWGYNVGFNKKTQQQFKSALVYLSPDALDFPFDLIYDSMAEGGCVIVWVQSQNFEEYRAYFEDRNFVVQPWPLIWSKITLQNNGGWPFSPNYNIGLILIKTSTPDVLPRLALNPSTSVISCLHNNDSTLPLAVVNWSLKAISQVGERVLLPCNASIVEVADCGNVPMWFEADKERYEKQVKDLKEFYEEKIPGVIIKH
jgi:ParB-like chromosome segregation protein Spo0J